MVKGNRKARLGRSKMGESQKDLNSERFRGWSWGEKGLVLIFLGALAVGQFLTFTRVNNQISSHAIPSEDRDGPTQRVTEAKKEKTRPTKRRKQQKDKEETRQLETKEEDTPDVKDNVKDSKIEDKAASGDGAVTTTTSVTQKDGKPEDIFYQTHKEQMKLLFPNDDNYIFWETRNHYAGLKKHFPIMHQVHRKGEKRVPNTEKLPYYSAHDVCLLARTFNEELHNGTAIPHVAFVRLNENWGAFSQHIPNKTTNWQDNLLQYWNKDRCNRAMIESYLDHPYMRAIFTTQHQIWNHPKVHSLPLGLFRKQLFKYQKGLSGKASDRTQLLMISHKNRPMRKPWVEKVIANFDGKVSNSFQKGNKAQKVFYDELSHSKFILSPSGLGMDCYRHWEAIYMGTIPVIETLGRKDGWFRTLEHLPVAWIDRFENLTPQFLEAEYDKIVKKDYSYEKLTQQWWIDFIKMQLDGVSAESLGPPPPLLGGKREKEVTVAVEEDTKEAADTEGEEGAAGEGNEKEQSANVGKEEAEEDNKEPVDTEGEEGAASEGNEQEQSANVGKEEAEEDNKEPVDTEDEEGAAREGNEQEQSANDGKEETETAEEGDGEASDGDNAASDNESSPANDGESTKKQRARIRKGKEESDPPPLPAGVEPIKPGGSLEEAFYTYHREQVLSLVNTSSAMIWDTRSKQTFKPLYDQLGYVYKIHRSLNNKDNPDLAASPFIFWGSICEASRAFEKYRSQEGAKPLPHVLFFRMNENWGGFSEYVVNKTADWVKDLPKAWKKEGCTKESIFGYLSHPDTRAAFTMQFQIYSHPKVYSLPLGIMSPSKLRPLVNAIAPSPHQNRPNLLMVNSKPRAMRDEAVNKVIENFGGTIQNTYGKYSKNIKDYYRELTSSKFILSPGGLGFDCYRHWEAITIGTIPVLETLDREDGWFKALEDLPVVWIDHYENLTPEFLEKEYQLIISKATSYNYGKLTKHWWVNFIKSHVADVLENQPEKQANNVDIAIGGAENRKATPDVEEANGAVLTEEEEAKLLAETAEHFEPDDA